jgi:bacterioferritin (cytochrome b1)
MELEALAKAMRERAIMLEGEPNLKLDTLAEIEKEKKKRLTRLEEMKKLYFNAGRWAGGARDRVARIAFEKVAIEGLKKK